VKNVSTYTITSSFSTGEARPLRGTSRREVGRNLAQRALKI
jgi:polyribonucleotide nucleotidyltransferase